MIRNFLAAASLLALSAVQANAATATSNLAVTLNINALCAVGAGTLDFGTNSNLGGAANIDATGSFAVTCTSGATYNTTLGNGGNYSGSSRRLINGAANYVNYSLYSDSGRTTPWATVAGTGTGASQTVSVYGRIPSGQANAAIGAYTDSVLITVTY
jgi:spore coat protein U-like protein